MAILPETATLRWFVCSHRIRNRRSKPDGLRGGRSRAIIWYSTGYHDRQTPLLYDESNRRHSLPPEIHERIRQDLNSGQRRVILERILKHYQTRPKLGPDDVTDHDQLIPAVEQFHALADLGQYEDAFDLFQTFMNKPIFLRLLSTRRYDWPWSGLGKSSRRHEAPLT